MLIGLALAGLLVTVAVYTLYARTGIPGVGRLGTGLAITCWLLLTAGLGQRGLDAGHWPLTNRYEAALVLVWAIVGIYLLSEASWRKREAGNYGLGVTLPVILYIILLSPEDRAIAPLLPALRSPWLQIHVLTTLIGYGTFGVAAGLGMFLLRQGKWLSTDTPTLGDKSKRGLPREDAERMIERMIALGFPWLTLGILTGAIWAQQAWGRYWGWDPKETWTLVTWLWYLLILHVLPLRNWRGRRLAGLAVAGFAIVLFTFVGVPWLVRTVRLESLHGF